MNKFVLSSLLEMDDYMREVALAVKPPQPLVSVCIPTYNRPGYLAAALASVAAQTYRNFEVIVTDNSTFDADLRTNHFAVSNAGLSVRYEPNGGDIGAAASLNRAISYATGKYVKVLMDDDLLEPNCLERMVAALEAHPHCAVAMAPMKLVDEDGDRIEPRMHLLQKTRYRYRYQSGSGVVPKERLLGDFLTRCYPCCVVSGVLFRASALDYSGPFSDQFGFAGDLHKVMQLACEYDSYYIDAPLSSWRLTDGCHTATMHRTGLDVSIYYKVAHDIADRVDWCDDTGCGYCLKLGRDGLLFCSMRAALNFIPAARRLDFRLAWRTLRTIMREDPHQKNWLRLPFALLWQAAKAIFHKEQDIG